jgi:hypothetical protein
MSPSIFRKVSQGLTRPFREMHRLIHSPNVRRRVKHAAFSVGAAGVLGLGSLGPAHAQQQYRVPQVSGPQLNMETQLLDGLTHSFTGVPILNQDGSGYAHVPVKNPAGGGEFILREDGGEGSFTVKVIVNGQVCTFTGHANNTALKGPKAQEKVGFEMKDAHIYGPDNREISVSPQTGALLVDTLERQGAMAGQKVHDQYGYTAPLGAYSQQGQGAKAPVKRNGVGLAAPGNR